MAGRIQPSITPSKSDTKMTRLVNERDPAALYFNDDLGSGLDHFVGRMINRLVLCFPLLSSSFVIIHETDDTTRNVDHFQNRKTRGIHIPQVRIAGLRDKFGIHVDDLDIVTNSVQTGLEPWFLVPGGYGDIVTHEARCGFVGLKMSFSGGILDAGPGS